MGGVLVLFCESCRMGVPLPVHGGAKEEVCVV